MLIRTGRPLLEGPDGDRGSGCARRPLVLAVGLWAGLSAGTAVIVTVVVALVTVVWALLETIRWKYTMTNRRVFVRHGLISVREKTARLERVQYATLRQTLFDRLFGVGRLDIDTAGSEGGAFEFKALTEPTHVRDLDAAVRQEQQTDV